jgi:hypothetical protein
VLEHGSAQQVRNWFSWKTGRTHAGWYDSDCFHVGFMLIEVDGNEAFHFELMTAFIYQDRLPL